MRVHQNHLKRWIIIYASLIDHLRYISNVTNSNTYKIRIFCKIYELTRDAKYLWIKNYEKKNYFYDERRRTEFCRSKVRYLQPNSTPWQEDTDRRWLCVWVGAKSNSFRFVYRHRRRLYVCSLQRLSHGSEKFHMYTYVIFHLTKVNRMNGQRGGGSSISRTNRKKKKKRNKRREGLRPEDFSTARHFRPRDLLIRSRASPPLWELRVERREKRKAWQVGDVTINSTTFRERCL